jgi:UDP-N-acetylmuramate dehydrogenase
VTARLRDALLAARVAVREDQPLGPWTTLGVGGAAALYAEPRDAAELAVVLRSLGDVPLLVLGRGSNMLVADSGWPGLALRLGSGFKWQRRSGDEVAAGAGTSMPALAAWLATEGLSGLEFAAGIPATVGGSVRMNAGAHGGQTGDRLLAVTVATPSAPDGVSLPVGELGLGYRHSALPPGAVVVDARWRLSPADPAAIRAKLDELRAWRRDTQPLRQRNCGSVFTNPPGDSAGRLIEAAGLKGRAVGGARVSEKHANFIVVDPAATTAKDVVTLIREVRDEVVARGGPLLEPEVRLVGFGEGW